MGTINVGKVRPVFKGTYDAATACNFYECWQYNGTWWLHIGTSPTTGTAPSEGTVWTAFGVKGDKGDNGLPGQDGVDGTSATITVGNVATGEAGTEAQVSNSGSDMAVVLDFTIPKGDKGDTGSQGPKGDTGEGFSVFRTYASLDEMNADAANVEEGKFVLIASSVEDEDNAKLYVKGSSSFTFLTDLSGAQGIKGENGSAATITVGSVTTGEPGTQASVTNAGTTSAAQLNFVIPRGATGAQGTAATVEIGSVTTGAAGSNASVTNSGTASAATLNFTIPQGVKGDAGVSITGAEINSNGELVITTDA